MRGLGAGGDGEGPQAASLVVLFCLIVFLFFVFVFYILISCFGEGACGQEEKEKTYRLPHWVFFLGCFLVCWVFTAFSCL